MGSLVPHTDPTRSGVTLSVSGGPTGTVSKHGVVSPGTSVHSSLSTRVQSSLIRMTRVWTRHNTIYRSLPHTSLQWSEKTSPSPTRGSLTLDPANDTGHTRRPPGGVVRSTQRSKVTTHVTVSPETKEKVSVRQENVKAEYRNYDRTSPSYTHSLNGLVEGTYE